MNEKIHSLLLAVAVFILSFAVSFLIFGGVSKISRHFQAKKIEQENQLFYAKQKKAELEKKQKKIEAEKEAQPSAENAQTGEISSDVQTTPVEGVTTVSVPSKNQEKTPAQSNISTAPSNEDLVNDLAKRFKGVLDLSTNQEWLTYPVEIRKAAFAKMNPPESVVSPVLENSVSPQSTPQVKQVELSSVDKMFLGEDVVVTQYTVVSHDSWLKISEKLSVSTDDLLKWNPSIKKLKVGDVLQIKKVSTQ